MSYNINYDSFSIVKVTSLPTLPQTTILDDTKKGKSFHDTHTLGGIIQDSNYLWKANGSHFQVFDSKTGFKLSSWNFGSENLTRSGHITCVAELKRHATRLPFLIIGLEKGSCGQICVFDLVGARVLKCIELEPVVTSLCCIDKNYHIASLSEALGAFDGIVAVGTANGNVYLLDICQSECEEVLRDGPYANDDVSISEVEILYPYEIHSVDVENYRGSTMKRHLVLHLNAITDNVQHFVLKGPKDVNRLFVNKEEVTVSAIHYCPQLGSLLVGYNFGAWQLWDFSNLEITYTSSVHQDNIPVSHFAVQEPCDDPLPICYIWVVYSNTEPYEQRMPLAILYSLNFEKKSMHLEYGVLYQNLTSCSVRFQIIPTIADKRGKNSTQIGASCVRLQVVNKLIRKHSLNRPDEVITVCFIVWSSSDARNPGQYKTYLNLFDLNQWYKEHMPTSTHSHDGSESFTGHICLTDILNKNNYHPTRMLDVQIDEEGLHQFLGAQKLEEHYYPSSLAFQITSLTDNAVTIINNKGSQQMMINSLESLGPSVLLQPTHTFSMAVSMGLTPLFVETVTTATLNDQREFLLSTALEQQMLGWLCRCVTTWSSGVYDSNGCSLNFLLQWGWQRAQILKANADTLAACLFDYSGVVLNKNSQTIVNHCLKQLRNLSMLFKFVIRKYSGFVLNSDVIQIQSEYLEFSYVYLEVLHWFQNVGLLPECPLSDYPKSDEFNRIFAPYTVEDLLKYYNQRRTDLNTCNMKKLASKENLLFIDNLIEMECGECHLQKQWEEDGGSGVYPPSSLQALLRTYLVESIEIQFKHQLVTYFLLDLVLTLQDDRYKTTITHLIKFPSVFNLSPSSIKIIQSFWQLDHGNFEQGIRQLLDPMISSADLKDWHHRLVLRTLFAQEQYNFALLYLQVRRPAVSDLNDLCTIISLYIANTMIDEAFHFQRQHQNTDISSKLLHHFFKECDKMGSMECILFLPLWEEEEEAFMTYLTEVNHSQRSYIQVLFYTQRSRYVDAMKINESSNLVQFKNKGLNGKQLFTERDRIMNHLECISNPLSKSILDECKQIQTKAKKGNCTPFSVFVHNSNERAKYKSSLLEAALLKSTEIWTEPVENRKGNKPIEGSVTLFKNRQIPFLCKLRAAVPQPKMLSPMIYPKLKGAYHEDLMEPPSKKFKPSSRLCMSSQDIKRRGSRALYNKSGVRLNTPLVKRKLHKGSATAIKTPLSILKSTIVEVTDSFEIDETLTQESINRDIPSARKRSCLGITPRRPLSRSCKPEVRFSLFPRRGSDSSEISTSSDQECTIVEEKVMVHAALDGSLDSTTSNTHRNLEVKSSKFKNEDSRKRSYDAIAENVIIQATDVRTTPRARRSYKGLTSSPRPKELFKNEEIKSSKVGETEQLKEEICYKEPSEVTSTYNLRKTKETKTSLCREVLENNAFNKLVASSHTISIIEEHNSTSTISVLPIEGKKNEENSVNLNTFSSSQHIESNESDDCEAMDVSEITMENDHIVLSEEICSLDENKNPDNVVDIDRPLKIKCAFVDKEGDEQPGPGVLVKGVYETSPDEVVAVTSSVEVFTNPEEDLDVYDDLNHEIYGSLNQEVATKSTDLDLADCTSDSVAVVEDEGSSSYTDEQSVSSSQAEADEGNSSQNTSESESVSSAQEVIEISSSDLSETRDTGSSFDESSSTEDLATRKQASSSESDGSHSSSTEKFLTEIVTEKNVPGTDDKEANDNHQCDKEFSKVDEEPSKLVSKCDSTIVCNKSEIETNNENSLGPFQEIQDSGVLENQQFLMTDFLEIGTTTTNVSEKLNERNSSANIDSSKQNLELFSSSKRCDTSANDLDIIHEIVDDTVYEDADLSEVPDVQQSSMSNYAETGTNTTNTSEKLSQRNSANIDSSKWNLDHVPSSKTDGSANDSDIIHEIVDGTVYEDADFSDILKTPTVPACIDNNTSTSIIFDATSDSIYCDRSSIFEDLLSLQTERQSTPVTRSKRPSSLHLLDTPEMLNMLKLTLTRNASTSESNITTDWLAANAQIRDEIQIIPTRRKRSASATTISTASLNEETSRENLVPERRKGSVSATTVTIAGAHKSISTNQKVPARRKRNINTALDTIGGKRQLRSRSVDVDLPQQQTKIKTTASLNTKENVDLPQQQTKTKTTASLNTKEKSGVEKLITNKSSKLKKSSSMSTLPQTGDDYSNSRRLTRRQAKMLENVMSGYNTKIQTQDVSNSDESSNTISSRLRSHSSLSESSTVHSAANATSASLSLTVDDNSVNGNNSKTTIQPRKLRRTRQNSKDSDTSTISEAHSEIVIKKPAKITRRTRSATDEIELPNLRRSKRNLAKSSLPKIIEEPTVEANTKTKKSKKNSCVSCK